MRGRTGDAAAATGGVDHGPGPVAGLLGLEELGNLEVLGVEAEDE
jgi:hypothetical protein